MGTLAQAGSTQGARVLLRSLGRKAGDGLLAIRATSPCRTGQGDPGRGECAWNSELQDSSWGGDSVLSHRGPRRVWRGWPSTGLIEGSVAGTWQASSTVAP